MRLQRLVLLSGMLLLSLPAIASAQAPALDQGSYIVGGSASFNSTGSKGADDRSTQFWFSPSLQYFIVSGLAVGGNVFLSHYSQGDFSATGYGVGPKVSYFFGIAAASELHPFVSTGVSYTRHSHTGVEETTTSSFDYSLSAGALCLLTESVGLNATLYYSGLIGEIGEPETEYDSNTFGLGIGFSAFLF